MKINYTIKDTALQKGDWISWKPWGHDVYRVWRVEGDKVYITVNGNEVHPGCHYDLTAVTKVAPGLSEYKYVLKYF